MLGEIGKVDNVAYNSTFAYSVYGTFDSNRAFALIDIVLWPIFYFQDGVRPPSWICFTRVGTTHEEYLVVFVTVQNLVVIGAVILIVCKF